MKFKLEFCLALLLLFVSPSKAGQPTTIKMVETSITVRLSDGVGQPVQLADGLRLEMFRFGRTPWERKHWAIIQGRPDSEGMMATTAMFPVDSVFITDLLRRARGIDQAGLGVGLRVLDGNGQSIRPASGIRLELSRFGKYPWPPGRAAVIRGSPDGDGYVRSSIQLPIDGTTLRNFALLLQGVGK